MSDIDMTTKLDAAALEPQRLQLECQKLEAEIAELQRSWWKRPGQWAAVFGGLATVLAILWGVFSGFLPAPKLEKDIKKTGYPLRSRIPYIWFPRLR